VPLALVLHAPRRLFDQLNMLGELSDQLDGVMQSFLGTLKGGSGASARTARVLVRIFELGVEGWSNHRSLGI
jgi:hypothetical protein